MANVKVFNMAGQEVGTMELSDVIFGADINGAVLHAAVRAYLLNQFPAAAESPGDRREPVAPVRVPPVLPSGHTAVSRWVPSPAATAPV